MRWGLGIVLSGLVLAPLVYAIASEPRLAAPRAMMFEGLPVQGSLADAQRAGFIDCYKDMRSVRCRRDAVKVKGQGPYNAAVDLLYGDGGGGFYELTVWTEEDQADMYAVGHVLAKEGWDLCRTGGEFWGDQEIYTKPGSPIRFSIDISYWGKRRLRILPELNQPKGRCW